MSLTIFLVFFTISIGFAKPYGNHHSAVRSDFDHTRKLFANDSVAPNVTQYNENTHEQRLQQFRSNDKDTNINANAQNEGSSVSATQYNGNDNQQRTHPSNLNYQDVNYHNYVQTHRSSVNAAQYNGNNNQPSLQQSHQSNHDTSNQDYVQTHRSSMNENHESRADMNYPIQNTSSDCSFIEIVSDLEKSVPTVNRHDENDNKTSLHISVPYIKKATDGPQQQFHDIIRSPVEKLKIEIEYPSENFSAEITTREPLKRPKISHIDRTR